LSHQTRTETPEHEKKCPDCAEYIKLEAQVCKHCGHEFSEDEVERQIEKKKTEVEKKREERRTARREPKKRAKERRICPTCETPSPLDQTECPRCGTDLTE
jgi:predicted amidophosphoribosyltransferase